MKNNIITIDGGTTNTRLILWNNNKEKISEEKRAVGVRNTAIDGNNQKLKVAVKECLFALINENSLTFDDIALVIASGMITSDVGIVLVPHLVAPAGLDEFAKATVSIELPDLCPIPIHFIPGLKNYAEYSIDLDNYEMMDIMRGEEVESLAIIQKYHQARPMVLVLPGSHNKFVIVNEKQQITACLTSISGELLAAITNDTIIAKSVNKSFVKTEDYDAFWLVKGYENAKKVGLGRACFSGRILGLFLEDDTRKIANYILGASLEGDIRALKNSSVLSSTTNMDVVVSGKAPLQEAIVDLFKYEEMFENIKVFEADSDTSLSALGAYLVAERRQLL